MYRALYRKWRPRKFADVVGQEAIVTALQNQIAAGRIGHAYLFTGTRGTGKTTCAKIFAKAVNCLDTTSPDPCGECAVCKGIDEGTILDVSEIDAASNNSVDDIRDLRDETAYLPAVCKYKVYIIDEVHMLSTSAFNALLKTMEEPPEHVIFILATTEVQKVPATILSRCQRYDFQRITADNAAVQDRAVADMPVLFHHRVLLRKTVHHAVILDVSAIFHHDTTKIATQAGIWPNVNTLAENNIADQYRCRMNKTLFWYNRSQTVYLVNWHNASCSMFKPPKR